jgi:DNA-binding winged helix-turn-helix (wHTH) protein
MLLYTPAPVDHLSHEPRASTYPSSAVETHPLSYLNKIAATSQSILLATSTLSFGPFHVLPSQRLLLEGDQPLRLGSRAFDILVALLDRAGGLVSKDELRKSVWPGTFVADGNLKVQVATLRRALRDGEDGNRYISTVPGRGYWFVAPVVRSGQSNGECEHTCRIP